MSRFRAWKPSHVTLAAAALAAVALIVRLVAGPRTIDDAYITFRYARNLAGGLGFVYNPGEPVLGTTTPLYTALMALSWLVGLRDLPWVATCINALADAGSVVVLFALGRRLLPGRPVGAATALAWAVAPMSVTFAIGGMETSVVIFFLIASFAAYVAGRSRLAAGLMALAVLTRPDALIAAGLLLADMGLRPLLARERRPLSRRASPLAERARALPWVEYGLWGGMLAPWVAFATLYFGSPLPQSIRAKAQAYILDPFDGLVRWLQHLSTPFFEHEVFGRLWPAIGLPLYLVLYLGGGLRLLRQSAAGGRRYGRALPMVVYPLAYVVVFSLANALVFRWYMAPPLPFYFLGILAGLDGILAGVAGRLHRPRVGVWAGSLLAALLIANLLAAYALHPDHGPDRPAPEMAWFKLELLYQRAAAVVNSRAQPDDVVAAGDIGALGWFTGRPILDTVGLISPEAAGYYPLERSQLVITYAIAPELIRAARPEYLVTLEVYVRKTLLVEPWFAQEYRLVEKLDTDIYGSDGMLIYERVR